MRFVLLFNLAVLVTSACLPQGFWPDKGQGEGVLGQGYDVEINARDVVSDDGSIQSDVTPNARRDGGVDSTDGGSSILDAGFIGDANALIDGGSFADAAAPIDAAAPDAAAPDAAAPGDFGVVFMEINYVSASFSTNPGRLYSDTEGWREPQWAPEPDSYRDFPEVWDIFDGIEIQNNPWGQGADIDGNDRLQWMFGLEELSQTGTVTLEIWGSGDFGSSTTLDVTNPLFGCGETLEIPFNPDDELLNFTIDMTDCVQPGEGVQAIRVENGIRPFSLQRMRLTMSDAR